eukprot:1189042-Prymnesium_polylepis.1
MTVAPGHQPTDRQDSVAEEVEPSTDQHDPENGGNPEGQPISDTHNEDGVMNAVDAAAVGIHTDNVDKWKIPTSPTSESTQQSYGGRNVA